MAPGRRTLAAGPDRDPDGSALLTTDAVEPLLRAAVEHRGGVLRSWRIDHVDTNPAHSTTATYAALVDWAYGRRQELIGVSVRAEGVSATDARAEIYADGEREVAIWLYPFDPDLPGLARAAYPEQVAEMISELGLVGRDVAAEDLTLTMIGYRPRRRAVLRVVLHHPHEVLYIKVLREQMVAGTLARYDLLMAAGVPAPIVAASTPDHLLVLRELPGRPLARALFDPVDPCRAGDLVALLDSLPPSVVELERRPPWSDSVAHYASMVGQAVPALEGRLDWMLGRIQDGIGGLPLGHEATHGDFHEGQVHVRDGEVVGILDIDTVGPGRRADDLACLVAHLSTIQRMNTEQQERVRHLLRSWVPVFDQRVEPDELRLRTAAVIISLATGPFRGQEPDWPRETTRMIDAAEAVIRQVS